MHKASLSCVTTRNFFPKVIFGNNSNGETIGYGMIKARTMSFNMVAYVKGLKHNMISVSQICDADNEVRLKKKTFIYDPKEPDKDCNFSC